MTIKIDVKRKGFPVKFGDLELWFDSSVENLRNFFNINEVAQQKLKDARERAEHIHFPEGIENYTMEEFEDKDIEKIDAAFDIEKEFIAAQYDILFGEGTFKKVYEVYPDIFALEDALVPLGKAIAKKIEELYSDRTNDVKKIKEEYLNKKAKRGG